MEIEFSTNWIQEKLAWARYADLRMWNFKESVEFSVIYRNVELKSYSEYEDLHSKWGKTYISVLKAKNKNLLTVALNSLLFLYDQEFFLAKKVYAEIFNLKEN